MKPTRLLLSEHPQAFVSTQRQEPEPLRYSLCSRTDKSNFALDVRVGAAASASPCRLFVGRTDFQFGSTCLAHKWTQQRKLENLGTFRKGKRGRRHLRQDGGMALQRPMWWSAVATIALCASCFAPSHVSAGETVPLEPCPEVPSCMAVCGGHPSHCSTTNGMFPRSPLVPIVMPPVANSQR